MNEDLRELLESLRSHEVEFVVIGGHAVAFHGQPRYTEDIDLWVGKAPQNARKLKEALDDFGAPIGDEGAEQFSLKERQMIRLGVPPLMADILNFAGGVPFEEVWARKETGTLLGVQVYFPSRDDLLEMKRVSGRPQDLADIDKLS